MPALIRNYFSAMPSVLALPAIPLDYEGASIFGGVSITQIVPRCELAGLAFYERVEARGQPKADLPKGASSGQLSSSGEDSAAGDSANPDVASKKKNSKDNSLIAQRVRQALEKGADLYDLVCIDRSATSDDIRKQWRKLALLFHPDKALTTGSMDTSASEPNTLVPGIEKLSSEELHEQFLQRHNAFEILIDPVMRRQYDSYASFDDRLPSEVELAHALSISFAEFAKLCKANFEKEARWCVKQPVPDFGDENTSTDKLKEFYKYWATHESWRDFANAGEYHLEEAKDREERKWMQKENWKVVKAMLKAERQRVMSFVRAVESRDPRLRAKSAQKPLTGAAAKAKAIADMKAAIIAGRRKLAEGRSTVRQVWNEWLVEKAGLKDEELSGKLDKFLSKDGNANAISDLAHMLSNVTKRYREPTADAAADLKACFIQAL